MLHYYTFEYGVVGKSDAFHVYCSRDRVVGLVVRAIKSDGAWGGGHSRFFVWDEGLGSNEYETEQGARTGVDFLPLRPGVRTLSAPIQPAQPK